MEKGLHFREGHFSKSLRQMIRFVTFYLRDKERPGGSCHGLRISTGPEINWIIEGYLTEVACKLTDLKKSKTSS
jgi:hypothetical protein